VARQLIFERALRREIANTGGGVFVALFAIMVTTQLIRLLGQAAGGRIPSEAVLALLGFAALNFLPVLIALTLFVSILLTITRSYRDSEMIVWFSSGVNLLAWVKPVLKFAAPLIGAIAALSMVLSPWAVSKSAELRNRMHARDDAAQVSPGVFRESSGAERVFFVEANSDEARARNIFVSSTQHGRHGVMVSREGYQETAPNGDRFLVLQDGRRYEGTPGVPDYRLMQFDRYAIRIEMKEAGEIELAPNSMSAFELLALWNNAAKAEMSWRLGIPLAGLNLTLLAIPLSFVNPRAGRTNNLVLALLTFLIYSNVLGFNNAWISQGRIPFEIGVWLVHVVMFLVLVLLFFRRILVRSWLRRP